MVSAFLLASLLSAPPVEARWVPPEISPDAVFRNEDTLSVEGTWPGPRGSKRWPVIRAQDGGTAPAAPAVPYEERTFAAPGTAPLSQPLPDFPPAGPPLFSDPLLTPPSLAPNGWSGGPIPQASQFGANGSQPFRYGWQTRIDAGYILPSQAGLPARDDLGVFELNTEWRHTAPLPNQWVFSFAPQFDLRLLDGPSFARPGDPDGAGPLPQPPAPGLPGDLYRVGADIQLTTPQAGPATFEFAFTPALATDFDRSIDSHDRQFDGRGALFLRSTPQWLWVLGIQYWDRLNDRIIPWAGAVFTPDDRWEFRLVYPNPQASVFIGTPWGVPHWLYVAGEYHIESYGFSASPTLDNQMESRDWRVMLGLRSEAAGISRFIEGGYIFNRHYEFRRHSLEFQNFDVDGAFMARIGMRF